MSLNFCLNLTLFFNFSISLLQSFQIFFLFSPLQKLISRLLCYYEIDMQYDQINK